MAEHIFPDGKVELKPSKPYIAAGNQSESARVALDLILPISDVEVRDIQIPADKKYTCWYVSIMGYEKLPVINLGLYPNGKINVEFRYMQFLKPELREVMQWQTTNWPYARISDEAFTVRQVQTILDSYVSAVAKALEQGTLKRGGTSAAESMVADILTALDGKQFVEGTRPEWLRNPDGKLLQLDFYFESDSMAIEVQGPHHFRDFFNKPDQLIRRQKNDRYKVMCCLDKRISMIWMNTDGIQKQLARLPFKVQQKKIAKLIEFTAKHHPCHVIWENPESGPTLSPTLDTK